LEIFTNMLKPIPLSVCLLCNFIIKFIPLVFLCVIYDLRYLRSTILKLIWAYGVQSWDTASNSNIEILQRFQNKFLRIIVDAPCYVTNDTLHHDFNVPYVRDEIRKLNQRYADRMKILSAP